MTMEKIDDKTLALLTPMGDDHTESAPPAEPVGDLTDDERAAGFWWGPSGDDDASDVLLSRDGRSPARANERRWEVFEAPWNAKNPSPIAWGSEHSRRENRAAAAREARARRLLRPPPAAPSGLRVAALPAPVCGSWEDELHNRADDLERYVGIGEHTSVDDAVVTLRAAAEVMGHWQRAHLGEPTPEERAAEEVLGLDSIAIHHGPFDPEIDALNAIADMAMKSGNGDPKQWLLKIVRVGLGALASDAKGGA